MSRRENEWEEGKFYRLSKQTNEKVLFYARYRNEENGNGQTVENEEGIKNNIIMYGSAKKRFLSENSNYV